MTGTAGVRPKPESVGAVSASILFADWVSSVQNFVQVFTLVYFLLVFAYILTSWMRMPYSIWLSRIQRFLYDVCEPYLRIFRRVIPPLGPLDISPIVAIFTLWIASQLVIGLLERFD
ncbi:MAG: YggT family protein [Actinobacteria bacterium]|nr:YggT family protein [Actinomycetota bacterium]